MESDEQKLKNKGQTSMIISNHSQENHISPNFQKFLKTKGSIHKLENLKDSLRETLPDSISFIKKQDKHTGVLFILTGKHSNKFLDLIPNTHFRELRTKPEKYLKEKAKQITDSKLLKKLYG